MWKRTKARAIKLKSFEIKLCFLLFGGCRSSLNDRLDKLRFISAESDCDAVMTGTKVTAGAVQVTAAHGFVIAAFY